MSIAALIILFLVSLITVPHFKNKNIVNLRVASFIMPFFVVMVSLLSFFGQLSHSNDSVVISFIFILLLIDKKINGNIKTYILNICLMLSSIVLLLYIDETIWLTMSILALIILSNKTYTIYIGITSFLVLLLPLSPQFESVYYQWGGLLLIPALLGLITSNDSFKRGLFGFLYIVTISDTKYMSLGYYPILIGAISLLLILLSIEKEEESYVYSLAIVPFVGIANLYNLIALFVLFEIVIFFKGKLLNIVNNIETEKGAIKNIHYQEILMILVGMYVLFSGPASPFAWLFNIISTDGYILALVFIIELLLLNQVCLDRSTNKVRASIETNKTEIIRVFVYLVCVVVCIGSNIFNFEILGIVPGLVFILILVINRKKRKWLYLVTEVKKSITISTVSPNYMLQDNPIENRGRSKKIEFLRYRFSGVDETIIWSLFIFIISIILIGRYL